ncbi:MAG: IS30 family transposase [Paludibacteraceae bacterium]|nr:IS30 family transposase [Paludibacteraceae bacterium]
MTACRLLLPFKASIKAITTDNGPEFARHDLISKRLGVVVYFVKPYHSWEKGAIENYNKLLSQYIPKCANLNDFSDEQIRSFQYKINSRPREKLAFDSPKNVFFKFF